MSEIDNGGPAFPFAATDPSNVPMQAQGMSLRDWFAGQALPALISYDDYLDYSAAAVHAYKHADAMLEARKVKP